MTSHPAPTARAVLNPCATRRSALGWVARSGAGMGLSALGLGMAGCSPTGPIKLGFLGGLTGPTADLGVAGRDSAQLAVEAFNAQGGVQGRMVELVAFDDRQKPEALDGMLEAIQRAQLVAMVGPMTSSVAARWLPKAEALKLVTVSPTVTSSDFTGLKDRFFRVCSDTREYATITARYGLGQPAWKRVVLVRDEGNAAYTRSWVAHFQGAFQAAHRPAPPVVAYNSAAPVAGLHDMVLSEALSHQPDVLVFVCSAKDLALHAQLLAKRGVRLPRVSAEWAATGQLLMSGGQAAEGVIVAQYVDPDSVAPLYRAFAGAFQTRHGRSAGFAEVAAYDATTTVLQALSQQRRGEPLETTLLRLGRFEGLQQQVVFDAHGDAQRQLHLTVVRQGRFVALT